MSDGSNGPSAPTAEERDLVERCMEYLRLSEQATRDPGIEPPKEADLIRCIQELGALRTSAAIDALEKVLNTGGIYPNTYTVAQRALRSAKLSELGQERIASDAAENVAVPTVSPNLADARSRAAIFVCTKCNSFISAPVLSSRGQPGCFQGHGLTRVRSFGNALLCGASLSLGIGGICGLVGLIAAAAGARSFAEDSWVIAALMPIAIGLPALVVGLVFSFRSGPAHRVFVTFCGYGCGAILTLLLGYVVYGGYIGHLG